ncbi:MAG: gamma-glutamyltransferase [Burkholderiaceae bacterium]|nr:gamma-glutamyltransferase [Burkholderiaceae bacterium]
MKPISQIRQLKPVLVSCALFIAAGANAVSTAPAQGTNGMVATAHRLATDIGVTVLKQGGNAIDAAVAVGYALAVTMPNAGNLGGGGFMVVRMADGRETMIDFREAAPLAAAKNMYLDGDGKVTGDAGARSWSGVAVPGTVAGLEFARKKFGTMPHKPLVLPALKLAKEGHVLDQWDDVVALSDLLVKFAQSDRYVAKYFLNNGRPYKTGELFKQPALARTLQAIADQGPDAFYKGHIADETVRASKESGGILIKADFEKYQALEYQPVHCNYRGYQIVSAAPPSSGGISLCETLNVLEGFPLGEMGYRSAENLHYMVETFRFAFADRNLEIGDPRFVQNATERLISKEYATALRGQISATRATPSTEVKGGKPAKEASNTTHYSIVDRQGNAVALTYSLGLRYGTGKVAGDAGFFLNDTMIGFTAKVGAPNPFGLIQGEANAIAPEKRSLSSMTPTVVLKDGKVFMVTGAMGGPRIITGTIQAILNVIDYGMSVKDAVDSDRIHHQWLPDTVYVEGQAMPPDARKALEKIGHRLQKDDPKTVFNAVNAVVVDPKTGVMTGAHDNREPAGAAKGF